MAQGAYWFRHDSNARDDTKCSLLIEQLGLEGYGIYWVLVETLREQPEYRYPLSLLPVLARKYNTTTEKIRVVVGNYGLFTVTPDEFFLSESLCKRMEAFDEKRAKLAEAGRKSGVVRALKGGYSGEQMLNRCSTDVQQMFNLTGTNAERVEKSRVDKNRVEKSREEKNLTSLDSALADFAEMRKKIKKPMTDRAMSLLKSKLDKLGTTDEEKVAILEQSILHGWQDVYALKEDGKNERTTQPGGCGNAGGAKDVPDGFWR